MTKKAFFIQLLLLLLFLAIVLGAVFFWLKIYTNHGQELEMPQYIDKPFEEAFEDAQDKSFEMIINDSIHRVGIPGGMVLSQNPIGGSKVKENRKIYVTTTKFAADEINFDEIRTLYGKNFENKSNELSYLSIDSEIKSTKYDPGESGHILEVWYNGELIDSRSGRKEGIMIKKGDKLEFVVSKNDGAQLAVPDLKCKSLMEARFVIEQSKFLVGDIKNRGEVINSETAVIVDQLPRPGTNMLMGDPIHLIIAAIQPEDCQ